MFSTDKVLSTHAESQSILSNMASLWGSIGLGSGCQPCCSRSPEEDAANTSSCCENMCSRLTYEEEPVDVIAQLPYGQSFSSMEDEYEEEMVADSRPEVEDGSEIQLDPLSPGRLIPRKIWSSHDARIRHTREGSWAEDGSEEEEGRESRRRHREISVDSACMSMACSPRWPPGPFVAMTARSSAAAPRAAQSASRTVSLAMGGDHGPSPNSFREAKELSGPSSRCLARVCSFDATVVDYSSNRHRSKIPVSGLDQLQMTLRTTKSMRA